MIENEEQPICYCTGTTTAKIRQLLANNVNTLAAIINETGVTTGCAACEYDVTKFIEQQLEDSQEAISSSGVQT